MSVFWGVFVKSIFIGAGITGLVEIPDQSPHLSSFSTNGERIAIDAFSTDGLLKKFDLKVLTDDKNFFLPYNAIPIINQRIKDECPEIIELVNQLQNF